jgi:hypothetical protein
VPDPIVCTNKRPRHTLRLLSCAQSVAGLVLSIPARTFAKVRSDKNRSSITGAGSVRVCCSRHDDSLAIAGASCSLIRSKLGHRSRTGCVYYLQIERKAATSTRTSVGCSSVRCRNNGQQRRDARKVPKRRDQCTRIALFQWRDGLRCGGRPQWCGHTTLRFRASLLSERKDTKSLSGAGCSQI